MREIAQGVHQLDGFPSNMVNIYLVGNTLIDAGVRDDKRRIFRQLKGHEVSAHALTHVHADHQGASKAVCETLNIPLYAGEVDAPAMESGDMSTQIPKNTITSIQERFWLGPPHPVERGLQEGDEIAGFTVLNAPGHSPGQVVYFRERDRVLIIGDVLRNISFTTLMPGLKLPPDIFTMDMAQNIQSAKKLAALNPKIVLFGHGEPLMDGAKMVDFVASL